MATSSAASVDEYIASLPPDRQKAISAVRDVIRENLPDGFEEGMHYGMIGYCVPLSRYPRTYNGQPLGIAALASQKGYMAVHLTCVYADPATAAWFEQAYRATGKKLDMGKGCVRFKKLEDLPLDVVGKAIARVSVEAFIARHEELRAQRATGKAAAGKAAAGKDKAAKAPAGKAKTAPGKTAKPAKKAASK
jgi:uncharacterized protein YdhG (YjbR/CyaY superfamily)